MSYYLLRLFSALVCAVCLAVTGHAKGGGHSSGSHSSGPVSVKGYTRSDGTYVAPHMRSAPNGTTSDNYSTKGNVNPYTGKDGTKTDTKPAPAAASQDAAANPSNAVGAAPQEKPIASPERPPMPLSTAVQIGMNKAQVLINAGSPSIKTDTSWFYLDRGWVRFKDDKVASVEARSSVATR